MKDTFNKEDLKKEIDGLKANLNTFVSDDQMYTLFDKKRDDLEKLNTLKKEYKTANKTYKKHNRIKNLAILGQASLFLVPMILVPSIVGIITTSALINDYKESYAGKTVVYYYDNLGKKSILDDELYSKDIIRVELPYEEMENGEYIKQIYEYDTAISNMEELEKIVNTDYLELLSELGTPDSKSAIVEDSIDKEENQSKISVIADLTQKSSGENANNKEIKLAFSDALILHLFGTLAGCITALGGLVPWGIFTKIFKDKLELLEVSNDNLLEKQSRNVLKGRLKEFKKSIKK